MKSATPRRTPFTQRTALSPPTRPFRRLAVAAAVCLLGGPHAAEAADTRWTGAASAPFWDLNGNWSAGRPQAADTRVVLGGFDTTLRSDQFLAGQVNGTGTLSITGGLLELAGPGSSLGRLELHGGGLSGAGEGIGQGTPATLTLGSLLWTGGAMKRPGTFATVGPVVTVQGSAVLNGASLELGYYGGGLRLNGRTHWQDGVSWLGGSTSITIGAGGDFHDEAASADHSLSFSYSRFSIEGRYRKTGAATTHFSAGTSDFINHGTMEVTGGALRYRSDSGATWNNEGTVTVAGAEMSLDTTRGTFHQSGTVNIGAGGRVAFGTGDAELRSTGSWNIASGGRLSIDLGSGGDEHDSVSFAGGAIHNDGSLSFRGGLIRITPDVALGGGGTWEALGGARLNFERGLEAGRLNIGEPQPYEVDGALRSYTYSSVKIAGSLVVDRLDWSDGDLETSGTVTVRGLATLTDARETWIDLPGHTPGKHLNSAFDFQGGVVWDGDGDIRGPGSIRVRAGSTFEDRNAQGAIEVEPPVEGTPRPTVISVASFVNEGRYEKTGAGETVILAALDNRGSIRATDAGTLTLAGSIDNRGSLEAVRSRLVLSGPLTQLSAGWDFGRLQGGSYIARNGTLVFNLGGTTAGSAPLLIHTIGRDTRVVLHGPQARMTSLWLGTDRDAFAQLYDNVGRLELLNGATLTSSVQLTNSGELVVGAGSVLRAPTFLTSSDAGTPSDTWLAGTIATQFAWMSRGRLSAGAAEGEVGLGTLQADRVALRGGTLLLDIAAADRFDRLVLSGTAELGGQLWVDFVADDPVLGTFRFLSAAGGLSGSFASLGSALDPSQYRLTLAYGSHFVDLTVAAVPEPGTWALMLLGLGGLVGGARRRLRG
ncbi:PEP-CTERM sorting domain-containing protein [Aquabacterium sp. A7-Y]|uniref:PEP-CTERM sorting domain-containing protein n=1 Tax=Aquabacterium sp. A7-Y TaxID=1349605 RepID=UPI00223D0C6F|nr:PEP-CTERM sorting domain-containing protein [Aquabacterium sp. A7-Y]MCW7542127.1 PEP-CTERM sorting domain-containing protein [Aquabacterium sp. A7-Y]